MADGVLLVVSGKELKNFHDHLKYDKSYKAEILFGFETDSYDILGIPEIGNFNLNRNEVIKELDSLQGSFRFKLPPFSGYKIKGKPLFKWALDNKLNEIEIPEKEAKIYNLNVEKIEKVSIKKIELYILSKIKNVTGDFRQEKIIKRWKKIFSNQSTELLIAEINIDCESGFYVRSLAHEIGKKLSSGALLFSLTRARVGRWNIEESIWPYN